VFEKLEQAVWLCMGNFSRRQWDVAQRLIDTLADKTEQVAFRHTRIWAVLRLQIIRTGGRINHPSDRV
jgi:hypothetical protein